MVNAGGAEVVELAKRLIRIESESWQSNTAIADALDGYLSDNGFDVERLGYVDENGEAKSCLVAKMGTGEAGFGVFAHSDTVPGMGGTWQPYEPHVDDGKLVGRGACDMKGPLAAALVAASRLRQGALRRPLYFIISADEEMAYTGAIHIVSNSETLKAGWPACGVVTEPTELRPVYAHKGGVRIKAIAKGVAAHTSTANGISANFLIAPFLADMASLAELFATDHRFRNTDFDPPTNGFNIVLDDGGCAPNVTAAETVCTISLRPMPHDHHTEAIQMILDAASKYRLETAVSMAPIVHTDPRSEIVLAALEATGASRPETAPYGTEAAVYHDYCDLVVLGPGSIDQAHTVGEWIDIHQLNQAVDVYLRLMQRFCL